MSMMATGAQPERREGTLSGARADFVAQLGRRVSEIRLGLQALEAEPATARTRDDLRRRFHALGSAARVLKFQALADELLRLESLVAKGSGEEGLTAARLATMRSDVDALMGLAWGEAADARRPAPTNAESEAAPIGWPTTALVIGDATLAEALLPEASTPGEVMIECERIERTSEGLEMARALAPDVVVLDADLAGSHELMEQLGHDPLTEPVPVVVVGQFSTSDRAARWVALGAAQVLGRPFSPRQLQDACHAVLTTAHRSPRPEPFGQLTLEQLSVRLAAELKRGLVEGAVEPGRNIPLALGDGHEVLAALWSAIVRIREVATMRSSGMVRFQNTGPEGAVAVASWAGEGRTPRGHRSALPETEQRLDGRTALVVDDDPSVTWFLAGVLRAAGATVLEARDGEAGLALAFRHRPDLVISDILMPKLDGFALCRALKRDILLRDVPVILLSWKEDLLQRTRELGANADGYLRKEASAALVLERVFEVLRPKLRVERRLQSGGEVRGRLDDLSVWTLLSQVIRHQPSARLSLRDAVYLYELEIRGGAARSATRTTPDGRFERGLGVLFGLLGVGAGRFVVTPSDAPLRGWLDGGTLEEQTRSAVAQVRAAQRLLSGSQLMSVQGVDLHLEALQPYFEASPSLSREILDKLAEGVSPRALLLRGGYSARLLEDVLDDAIVHGAVARVVGAGSEDLLPAAVEREMALLERGEPARESSEPPPVALYAQFTPSPVALPLAPSSLDAPEEASAAERENLEASPPAEAPGEPGGEDAWRMVDEEAQREIPPALDPSSGPSSSPPSGPSSGRQEASSVAPTWERQPSSPSPMESALLDASPVQPEAAPHLAPGVSFADTLVARQDSEKVGAKGSEQVEKLRTEDEPPAAPPVVLEAASQVAPPVAPGGSEETGVEAQASEGEREESVAPPAVEPSEPARVAEAAPTTVGSGSAGERPSTGLTGLSAPVGEVKIELGTPLRGLTPALVGGLSAVAGRPEVAPGASSVSSLPAVEVAEVPAVLGPVSAVESSQSKGLEEPEALPIPAVSEEPSSVPVEASPATARSGESIPAPRVSESQAKAEVVQDRAEEESDLAGLAQPSPVAPAVKASKRKVSRETSARAERRTREEPSKSKGGWGWVLAVLGLVVVGSAWTLRQGEPAPAASKPTVAAVATATTATAVGPERTEPEGASTAEPRAPVIEDVALTPGETVPEGQGMLEVLVGRRDDVLVDRREVGRGPQVSVPLTSGVHEVRARRKGDDQPVTVVVKAGRRTRVDLRGSWRR